jgi:murein DD-endopeptidase MepM/ murein hydrolase activator NlpD
MARRHWTFVMTAEEGPEVRRSRLPRELVRLAIALALLAVAGVSSALTSLVLQDGTGAAPRQLVLRNRLLRGELRQLNASLDTLRATVDSLQRRDRAFRLIAGLEPIHGDVHRVGIGGPDADSVQARPSWVLDRTAAREAYRTSVALSELLRRARLLSFSWREAEDSVRDHRDRLESTPSIIPAAGYVSSGFSAARMHPILDRPRPHRGLDIVADYGTPFVASAKGRVRFVGYSGEYGLTIEIDHGRGMLTRYAHASRALVRLGQLVARGDTIGRVGRSGLAAGSHLHYEVLVNGQPKNPQRYIFKLNVIPD